ncbi:hypothetical protein D9M69_355000 [compost metagenome]
MELIQVLGRQAAQGDVDDAGQFRPVPPGGDPQQLRKADIPDDRQPGEFLLAGQAAELGFVQHRVAYLLGEQRLQGLALAGHGLQVEVGVGGAQVVGHRTGLAHGDGRGGVELFQIHRRTAVALADQQLRDAQVRIGEEPEPQAGGRLDKPGGEVDLPRAQRLIQFRRTVIGTPDQLHAHGRGQPVHQLDVGPRELLQAPVQLDVGRLLHSPDAQLAVRLEPLSLGRVQGQLGRRRQNGHYQAAGEQQGEKRTDHRDQPQRDEQPTYLTPAAAHHAKARPDKCRASH